MFWNQLHLAVPAGRCQFPGNQAQGASECQAWPRPGPHSTGGSGHCQAPASMKCSSHQKEQIQHFILSTWCPEDGDRGRTHNPQALSSRHLYSSVQSCPLVPPHHTDGFSPKSHQAPGLCLSPGQGLNQKAIIATKGRKTLQSGQVRQRKMLRWVAFFQLDFFFFMKKDHTEFSNKQNAKKIVLNKT